MRYTQLTFNTSTIYNIGEIVKEPTGATLDTVYRPVWQTDQARVDLFYAKPILRDENGVELPGFTPLIRQQTVDMTMQRQVRYLKQAFEALHLRFSSGERFRLLVRINSVALATAEAASVVTDTMRLLSTEERSFIVPEIIDFPESLSLNTLDEITIPLMAFFDTWLAQPEKTQADFTPFANLNYGGVTLDLFDKPMDLKLAGKVFQLFAQRASHRRLPTWVLGLATPELAKVARICGINGLSGAYMNKDTELPGPVIEGQQAFMV